MRSGWLVAALCSGIAMAQAPDPGDAPGSAQLNLADGPVQVNVKLHLPLHAGPAQEQANIAPLAGIRRKS